MGKAKPLDGKLYVNPELPIIEEYELYYILKEAADNGTIKEGMTFKQLVDAVGNLPRGRNVCPWTAEKERVYEVRAIDVPMRNRIGFEFDEEEKIKEISQSCLESSLEDETEQKMGNMMGQMVLALTDMNADGPDPDKARFILEKLKEEGAKTNYDVDALLEKAKEFVEIDTMTLLKNPFNR